MATTYKILGQSAPTTTTLTDVYTTPAATSTIVSTLTVANRSATEDTFRIAVRPAGATVSDEHYIIYDAPVSGNSLASFTIGLTLAETDVISVYSTNGTTSFNVFGSELT